MILLRQENQQEIDTKILSNKSPKTRSNNNSCIHKENDTHLCIYPCCYQLSCNKCYNKSNQSHTCMLTATQSLNIHPIPFQSQEKFHNKYKDSKLHPSNNKISCSLCQKSYISDKDIELINCLNCKKQFCKQCCFQIHSKSKFMSHKLQKIDFMNPQLYLNKQEIFTCKSHKKFRKYILKDKIVCELCIKQRLGRYPSFQIENIDISMVEQNIKFSQQYFNEIYHNQANKMAQLKQNLTKIYQDSIQRLKQKYQSNLIQIQKIESHIKKNFTQSIILLNKMTQQVKLISNSLNILSTIPNKNFLNTRILFLQQKLHSIQIRYDQFIIQTTYDYKVNDKDKYQHLIQQFLKSLSIIKLKHQQDQSLYTNRSSFRNNLKTSRTGSRPSSDRLTESKDNRCYSSFRKNQNISSSKQQNSSFKNRDRNSFNKKSQFQLQINRNEELTNSVSGANRSSMGKSVIKNYSIQTSINTSRNNSTFFKQKEKNIDNVKQLQKAEYQDLNLNLRKLIAAKKKPQNNNKQNNQSRKQSQAPSQSTSLQKKNTEKYIQAQNRKNQLTKQNQKSTINSGSFLKIFDQKNKVSARKNYLVTSGQNLQDIDSKHKIVVQTSSINLSPQNHSQLKKQNIKNQIYGSHRESPNNKFSDVERYDKFEQTISLVVPTSRSRDYTGYQQFIKSNQDKYSQQRSVIFKNLVAASGQQKQNIHISEFSSKVQYDHVITENQSELIKSQISQFSSILNKDSVKKKESILKDVQMTMSINVSQKNQKTISVSNKQRGKIPSTSKASAQIFKDTTNTMKQVSKNVQQKSVVVNQKLKKKPDFMDMRQRMKKPNYLSTRLANNNNFINGIGSNKINDNKK